MDGNALGIIIFTVGTVGVGGAIVVDVVKTMRQHRARRAAYRDAGSVDYDHEFMKSPPSVFVQKYASAPEAFFDDAPAGGVSGSFQINRNNAVTGDALVLDHRTRQISKHLALGAPYGGRDIAADNPNPPVDFAALRGRLLKEWEHAPGDPMPRPEHYDGVMRNIRMRSVSANADGSFSVMGDAEIERAPSPTITNPKIIIAPKGVFDTGDRRVRIDGRQITDDATGEALQVNAADQMIPKRFYVRATITGKPWAVLDRNNRMVLVGSYEHRRNALRKARQMNAADAACPTRLA